MTAVDYNIQRMTGAIDFIEAHLKYPIQVREMANATAYSIFHFCRLFNATVHHTPYDYLMRRRLTEAAKELSTTSRKIIEIALDYQFNSPEVFTRAFSRFFNQSPRQWKKHPQNGKYMPRITRDHLVYRSTMKDIDPHVVNSECLQIQGTMQSILDLATGADLSSSIHFLNDMHKYNVYWKNKVTGQYDCCLVGYLSNRDLPPDIPVVTKKFDYQRYLTWPILDRKSLPFALDTIFHTWQTGVKYELIQDVILEIIENPENTTLWIPVQ